jgi:thiol-disulfide isomerase/thioredoxin
MSTCKAASIVLLALGFCFATVPASLAATEMPFAQSAFAESQKTGKAILVYVNASWCPTCAQQRPIIEGLIKDTAFKDLIIYQVDFDKQKDVVKSLGARMQSTMIAF